MTKNESIWLIYCKFIAIYPEESNHLVNAAFLMKKIKESLAKAIFNKLPKL
jgi:hypothetical protein